MTVEALIAKLQTMPPHFDVLAFCQFTDVADVEGEVTDVSAMVKDRTVLIEFERV